MPKTTVDLIKLAARIVDLADEIYEALEDTEYMDEEECISHAYLYSDSLLYSVNQLRDGLRAYD